MSLCLTDIKIHNYRLEVFWTRHGLLILWILTCPSARSVKVPSEVEGGVRLAGPVCGREWLELCRGSWLGVYARNLGNQGLGALAQRKVVLRRHLLLVVLVSYLSSQLQGCGFRCCFNSRWGGTWANQTLGGSPRFGPLWLLTLGECVRNQGSIHLLQRQVFGLWQKGGQT